MIELAVAVGMTLVLGGLSWLFFEVIDRRLNRDWHRARKIQKENKKKALNIPEGTVESTIDELEKMLRNQE